jgi:hypothetical protein
MCSSAAVFYMLIARHTCAYIFVAEGTWKGMPWKVKSLVSNVHVMK